MRQIGQHNAAEHTGRAGEFTLPGMAAAAVAVTLAVTLSGAGLRLAAAEAPSAPTSATESTSPSFDTSSTTGDDGTHPLPRSAPKRLTIPALGLETSRLVALRRTPAGGMEVPARAGVVGWFHAGSTPGAAGAAILYGHTRLASKAGAFRDLDELRVGDTVLVRRADGRTVVFTVYDTARVADPAAAVELATTATRHAELRLLTWSIDESAPRTPGRHSGRPLVVLATLTATRS